VGAMTSTQIWKIVGRVYDDVESALWAILFAFVIYFIIFIVPRLSEIRAQNLKHLSDEIAAENASYCAKLGMKDDAQKYRQCLMKLGDFRLKVEKRVDQQYEF
jgi:hypothetical protein